MIKIDENEITVVGNLKDVGNDIAVIFAHLAKNGVDKKSLKQLLVFLDKVVEIASPQELNLKE